MRTEPQDITDHNARQRNYFAETDQRTLKPTASPYLRRHIDVLTQFAGIRPGDKVLEVGCGAGRYTLLLAEMGINVEGLDLTPKVLEQLRSFNTTGHQIPLHAIDILDCPPEMDGTFDSVIGFFVLHHVHDLRACFTKMAQLVKPGGTLCFIEPNPRSPLYYVQIFCTPGMKWSEERGLLKMRPETLQPELSAAGLIEPSFKRFGFFPPFVTNRPGGRALESVFEKVPVWEDFLPFQMARAKRPGEPAGEGPEQA
ncbi:MAG TPA: class I SAM-dependent methyltransferase [Actinomycetota bacterium]|nr:class I SAM-dependent methyltransferase [Actinomycetota bacterium]